MLSATVENIRNMERQSIAAGTPEYLLMRRAGEKAAAWIGKYYADAVRFVILCGGGNNGGDALVAAAELSKKFPVHIYSVREFSGFGNCAACAAKDLPSDIPFEVRDSLSSADFRSGDVIVDGLLGIGFSGGTLRENVKSFIHAANNSHCPVVALDLPSGINGDTGEASPNGAVNAEVTLTFGRPKNGLFRGAGALLRGALRVIDIGLSEYRCSGMEIMTNCDAVKLLPSMARDCHKNLRGRVLIWGGSPEYPGAPALSTSGALRSGAGMVRTVSEADLTGRVPNAAIVRKLFSGETPEDWFVLSDVLVCGCGWGGCANEKNLQTAWDFPGKLLLDADALNGLAHFPQIWKKRENVILTPHPGEAVRLATAFGVKNSGDRRELSMALAEKLHAAVVLKGRDSIVAAPDGHAVIIAAGSPALATAGSGDVLAGVIGALAAGTDCFNAAVLGAYVHGIAGENASGILIADDLPAEIGKTLERIRLNAVY